MDTHLDAGDSTASLRSSIPSARNLMRPDVEPGETFDDAHAEEIDEKEDKLAAWLQCSGLHTVGKWVLNYRKHPSCWAALLVLHGVPEVTGRLRAKVENYAIYSALFLSCTIAAVMDPPPAMDCERRDFDGDYEKYRCEVAKRVAAYALIASVAMHFLAIILAMGEFIILHIVWAIKTDGVFCLTLTAARRVRDSHVHAHVALAVQQRKPGELLANRAGRTPRRGRPVRYPARRRGVQRTAQVLARDVGRPAGKHEGILRGGFADERRRRHTRGWKRG